MKLSARAKAVTFISLAVICPILGSILYVYSGSSWALRLLGAAISVVGGTQFLRLFLKVRKEISSQKNAD